MIAVAQALIADAHAVISEAREEWRFEESIKTLREAEAAALQAGTKSDPEVVPLLAAIAFRRGVAYTSTARYLTGYSTMGRVHRLRELNGLALTCFREVIELDPANIQGWFNFAVLCETSDVVRASEAYEKVIVTVTVAKLLSPDTDESLAVEARKNLFLLRDKLAAARNERTAQLRVLRTALEGAEAASLADALCNKGSSTPPLQSAMVGWPDLGAEVEAFELARDQHAAVLRSVPIARGDGTPNVETSEMRTIAKALREVGAVLSCAEGDSLACQAREPVLFKSKWAVEMAEIKSQLATARAKVSALQADFANATSAAVDAEMARHQAAAADLARLAESSAEARAKLLRSVTLAKTARLRDLDGEIETLANS